MHTVTLIIDKRRELSVKYKKLLENKLSGVIVSKNFISAMKIIQDKEPDLIIISDSIDSDLGDYCKKIRALTYNMRPVIVALSKSSEVQDRLNALANGADDFLSEPVNNEEFVMRMKAHLRREFESNLDSKKLLPNNSYSMRALKRILTSKDLWGCLYISIENFKNYRETYTELASDKLIQTFCAIMQSSLNEDDYLGGISENEFLIIKTECSSGLGRYTNGKIVQLQHNERLPQGCRALNIEQKMLWECLLAPPEIAPLVVVKGAAGTGKTYCSIAMALDKLKGYSEEELYDQILVATPTVTVSGENIGYLPGDIEDKVGPYLGGIMDNLKAFFRERNKDYDNLQLRQCAEELFERGFIEIQPIGFLRGRTIPKTVFIIDETQNIRPSDIQDIVTRAAKGSKFIFLGDPDQINNPELNTRYNGLVYLSEKMKGNALCWQITLNSEKSIRSNLAQEALKIL